MPYHVISSRQWQHSIFSTPTFNVQQLDCSLFRYLFECIASIFTLNLQQMASINEMPPELLSDVFKMAASAPEPLDSQGGHMISLWKPLQDPIVPAVEDRRIMSTYPFNIMYVCDRWNQILSNEKVLEFSTRLVFDVARSENAKILDVLPEPEELEIVVVSNLIPLVEGDEARASLRDMEKKGVCKIMTHILRHIEKCKYVTFNLKFTSSLPPASVFLSGDSSIRRLTLNAEVNDGPGREIGERPLRQPTGAWARRTIKCHYQGSSR